MSIKNIKIFLILLFLLLAAIPVFSQTALKDVFINPPHDAKPRGYWVWGQGNYDYTRIGEELKAFSEMGLGGVDIFDMGISDPLNMIPDGPLFMRREQLDGIGYAMREAKKLGLSMGLSVSNGWNAGGEWTTPDEMIMQLLFFKDTIQGPVSLSKTGFPVIPMKLKKPYGEYPLYPKIGKDGFPEYYKNVSLIAYPYSEKGIITDLSKIIEFDVSAFSGNEISVKLPEGKWILQRSVVVPLGQKMWSGGKNSKGFIMDHFSQKATQNHFNEVIKRLEGELGDLGKSALERLYLCSFESEDYVMWSPDLPEQFFSQHGYKIGKFLPALAGQIVVDKNTTDRFLHDYRSVVSEMFINNHYRQARDISHLHGVLLASESGGPGPPLHNVPTEDLKALGSVDIMRGEFWNNKKRWDDAKGGDLLTVVKNIASAGHIYGHKIIEMESFTSQNKNWQENPLELKKIADYAFCNGMTRVVYHTMSHSPKEAGLPGWSYSAGTHISPNLTWWTLSKPFHEYLTRVSAMLQQGDFVADVAYYYGEEIPNFATGYKYIRESLGEGYDYDDLNTEVLLQTTEVVNGKIKLPSGMMYSLLVLPDDGKMSVAVIKKVEELIKKGATILGNKPSSVYGLNDYKEHELELKIVADRIWGKSSNIKKQRRAYEKGWIITGYSEKEILAERGIGRDFQYTVYPSTSKLDYIHRSTGSEEIFFVRNADSVSVSTFLKFRVKGMRPQLWNPADCSFKQIAVFSENEDGINLPLKLDAFGSIFVVFSGESAGRKYITSVIKDGKTVFPAMTPGAVDFSVSYNNDSFNLSAESAGRYSLVFSDRTTKSVATDLNYEPLELVNSWDVRFTYGWGFDPVQKFEKLIDWNDHPDSMLKIYSGLATYKTSFVVPDGFIRTNTDYYLDLGRVGEVARLFINGYESGISIFPPHKLLISSYLREGENFIAVEVANTWQNQLTGESKTPQALQRTQSNLKGDATGKKGVRAWNGLTPLPSGLMGPVKIISEKKY